MSLGHSDGEPRRWYTLRWKLTHPRKWREIRRLQRALRETRR